jgi:hypothetical protein
MNDTNGLGIERLTNRNPNKLLHCVIVHYFKESRTCGGEFLAPLPSGLRSPAFPVLRD